MATEDEILKTLNRIEKLLGGAGATTGLGRSNQTQPRGAGTRGREEANRDRDRGGRGAVDRTSPRTYKATTAAMTSLGDSANRLNRSFSGLSKTVLNTRANFIEMNRSMRAYTRGAPSARVTGGQERIPGGADASAGLNDLLSRLLITLRPGSGGAGGAGGRGGRGGAGGPGAGGGNGGNGGRRNPLADLFGPRGAGGQADAGLRGLRNSSIAAGVAITGIAAALTALVVPLAKDYLMLHSAGIQASSALGGMYIDAALAGMSLAEYTKVVQESSAAVTRSRSMADFNNTLDKATYKLRDVGIFGEEATKLAATLANSSTAIGIPQEQLGQAMEQQVAVFRQLRKTSLLTASGFDKLYKEVTADQDVQSELIGLSRSQRAARSLELTQIGAIGYSMGATKEASDALGKALLDQRKLTIGKRLEASSTIRQAGAVFGMDAGRADELARLSLKKNKTLDEQTRTTVLSSELEGLRQTRMNSGNAQGEYIAESFEERFASAGILPVLTAAANVGLQTDSGQAGINKDFSEDMSSFGKFVGVFASAVKGLSQNPVAETASSIAGIIVGTLGSLGLGALLGGLLTRGGGGPGPNPLGGGPGGGGPNPLGGPGPTPNPIPNPLGDPNGPNGGPNPRGGRGGRGARRGQNRPRGRVGGRGPMGSPHDCCCPCPDSGGLLGGLADLLGGRGKAGRAGRLGGAAGAAGESRGLMGGLKALGSGAANLVRGVGPMLIGAGGAIASGALAMKEGAGKAVGAIASAGKSAAGFASNAVGAAGRMGGAIASSFQILRGAGASALGASAFIAKDLVKSAGGGIKNIVTTIAGSLKGLFTKGIVGGVAAATAGNGAASIGAGILPALTGGIKSILSGAFKFLGKGTLIVGGVLGVIEEAFTGDLGASLNADFDKSWFQEGFSGFMSKLTSKVLDLGGAFIHGIATSVTGLGDVLIDGWNASFGSFFEGLQINMESTFTNLFDRTWVSLAIMWKEMKLKVTKFFGFNDTSKEIEADIAVAKASQAKLEANGKTSLKEIGAANQKIAASQKMLTANTLTSTMGLTDKLLNTSKEVTARNAATQAEIDKEQGRVPQAVAAPVPAPTPVAMPGPSPVKNVTEPTVNKPIEVLAPPAPPAPTSEEIAAATPIELLTAQFAAMNSLLQQMLLAEQGQLGALEGMNNLRAPVRFLDNETSFKFLNRTI